MEEDSAAEMHGVTIHLILVSSVLGTLFSAELVPGSSPGSLIFWALIDAWTHSGQASWGCYKHYYVVCMPKGALEEEFNCVKVMLGLSPIRFYVACRHKLGYLLIPCTNSNSSTKNAGLAILFKKSLTRLYNKPL